jgi:hypothetical protein
MVAGESLTRLELSRTAATILTPIPVSREQKCVRHLPAEAPWHVNELGKSDDDRPRQNQSLRSHNALGIRLDYLCLSIDDQAQGPPHRYHGQWLE